ncbi:hypothetical protein JXO59_16930 [candidate division KSB1 bacterium]|nr:hypothetical protein [candidate division KSB1 bacterium]
MAEIDTIYQDFSTDPGWEGVNNRVRCDDCPIITQDFGWRPTGHNGDGTGEIGGVIYKSTTPAYYAMPIGPFSFKDKLSASGKMAAIAPAEEGEGFYIGFFNHARQGWRVWSSCGFRIGDVKEGKARFHLDYKTGQGAGAILNPDIEILCDGSVHRWELIYEPEVTVGDSWPDSRLPRWINSTSNVHEDEIFARAQKDDATMTREKLHDLLLSARDAGLVDHWYRKGSYHLWNIEKYADRMKGRITFRFDDQPAVSYFLLPGHADQPSRIDRFGVYNMQMYHGSMQFFLSDLTVNGEKIELSQDPHWDGLNNHMIYRQTDFHARQDFGYTQTNWAGRSAGELGGRFYGTEVLDPLHGFYADDIGKLTLDDAIFFSGWINFVEGAVDGRMLIGYFNREVRLAPVQGEYKGNPPHQFIGIEVMDQTQIGYSFTAVCSPRQDLAFEERGPIFIPDRIKRPFSFQYDPAGGEYGRITITLGSDTLTADLDNKQRQVGAVFDRFGLLNPRKGGKYVDVYFDDLRYVARRKEKPAFQKQIVVTVPYPEGGRLYK